MGTCIIDLSTQPGVGIDTLIFIPILINMNQIDNNNNNNNNKNNNNNNNDDNNNNNNNNFPLILKYRYDIRRGTVKSYGQMKRS